MLRFKMNLCGKPGADDVNLIALSLHSHLTTQSTSENKLALSIWHHKFPRLDQSQGPPQPLHLKLYEMISHCG